MGLAELTKECLGDRANSRTRDQLILETMTTKSTDFKETMTAELTGFIQSQARVLSLADLNRLVIDLPALRERLAKIPSETYPYLSDQLEFLCLFVEEQIVGRNRDAAEEPVAEAARARCSIFSA